MAAFDWTAHAERAEALAARYPSATEILTFYATIAHSMVGAPGEGPFGVNPPELGEALLRLSQAAHEPKVTPPFPHYCPCCGSPPGAAVLRPEADGMRRWLLCSACAYEWPYPRILCPNCQENRFEELPVYIAESYPHLRVECCDACKRYLIAADLSKDSGALPLVEDIAALPLHLWAKEHGYTKIAPNLFGF